jgi:hypothetical protein
LTRPQRISYNKSQLYNQPKHSNPSLPTNTNPKQTITTPPQTIMIEVSNNEFNVNLDKVQTHYRAFVQAMEDHDGPVSECMDKIAKSLEEFVKSAQDKYKGLLSAAKDVMLSCAIPIEGISQDKIAHLCGAIDLCFGFAYSFFDDKYLLISEHW